VVKGFVLDAHGLGVPQARKRLIFVGVREDLGKTPTPPPYLSYVYSASEAIAGLPPSEDGDTWGTVSDMDYKLWSLTKQGSNFVEASLKVKGKPHRFNWRRLNANKPSPTVTTFHGHFHWDECRRLTLPEYRRLSTFPDDFVLTGIPSRRLERIGRAVPPLMMKAISCHIARDIFGVNG
jgi:DNA (cytosine-5)-methyltransferase 1